MPKNSQPDIRTLVDSFVDQLTHRIRTSAVESVQAALLGGSAPAARRGRKPGPQPGKAAGPKPKAAKPGKRGRRSSEEIDAAKGQIVAHVKANPGTAMGELSKTLGLKPITIRAQVNELLKAKALRKEGERRGTRYFAGAGGGAKKATTKRGKRATKKKTARK